MVDQTVPPPKDKPSMGNILRLVVGFIVIFIIIGIAVEAVSSVAPKIGDAFGLNPDPHIRQERISFLTGNYTAINSEVLQCYPGNAPNGIRASDDDYFPSVLNMIAGGSTLHRRLLNLNNFVSNHGVHLINDLERQQYQFNFVQFSLVFLGCLSTILVGMKSVITSSNWFSQSVGVLAICASAGGAALATLNTSSHLSDVQSQTKQDLQQVTVIQARLRFFIARTDSLCVSTKDSITDSDRDYLQTLEASAVDLISGNTTAPAPEFRADKQKATADVKKLQRTTTPKKKS